MKKRWLGEASEGQDRLKERRDEETERRVEGGRGAGGRVRREEDTHTQ